MGVVIFTTVSDKQKALEFSCIYYNAFVLHSTNQFPPPVLLCRTVLAVAKIHLFFLNFGRYNATKSYMKGGTLQMEIKINLGDKKRKELAVAISELLGAEPVYQRAKNHAYEIGGVTLNRDNTLNFASNANVGKIRQFLNTLEDKGFPAEELPDKLVIQMPIDGFDDVALDNLQKLIIAKAELIKKALGIEDLSIEKTGEGVFFEWFAFDTPSEDVTAYSQFISALCDMAKKQKRVLATEKSVENEKYAFRCFLLRLGFIGEEYAEARKVLLRNLNGNGSWKSGSGSADIVKPSAPKSDEFEKMAEAISRHILRGIFQSLEAM